MLRYFCGFLLLLALLRQRYSVRVSVTTAFVISRVRVKTDFVRSRVRVRYDVWSRFEVNNSASVGHYRGAIVAGSSDNYKITFSSDG